MRIDVVEFGGGEQRGEDGPGPAAAIRSREERVLARDGLRSDRALNGIVVDVESAVLKEAFERGAAPYTVADRLGQFGFARDALEFGLSTLEQFGHNRSGCRTPRRQAEPRTCSSTPHRAAIRSTVQVAVVDRPATWSS